MNTLERFGDRLRAIGYTLDGIAERFGDSFYASSLGQTPQFARAAASFDDTPLGVATHVFLHGQQVTKPVALRLFGDLPISAIVAAGLGELEEDIFRPTAAIHPYDEQWFVVSDFGESVTGVALPDDHVVGIGGASSTLAQVTPQNPVGSVWDLGTGCGVQALHATRYASTVVATDVSPRAVRMAQLSATLSGVSYDVMQGSFDEPVAGRRFDRIVSNPPFVITARGVKIPHFTYRDAGLAGDELLTHLLQTLPSHLTADGSVHMLANWELPSGADTAAALTERLAATGLDYWVIERQTQPVAEYVALWMRDAGTHMHPNAAGMYQSWVADFQRRGINRIGFGIIMLFQRSDKPATRIEAATGPLEGDVGTHLLAAYQHASAWEQLTAQQKLDARFIRAGHVVEAQYRIPGDEAPTRIELLGRGGVHRSLTVDALLAGAVGVCDGQLTVSQIAAGLAALSGNETADVAARLLAAAPTLLWSGILTIDADAT